VNVRQNQVKIWKTYSGSYRQIKGDSMKSVLTLVLAIFVAGTAEAVEIIPAKGAPVCLQRVYAQKHLGQNPKQKLSELTIKLEARSFVGEQKENIDYNVALLVARNVTDNELYGNTAWCNYKKDGSAACQIDCDGGSFDLKKRSNVKNNTSWINFVVTAGYYFPFFKGVLEPDIENTPEELALDGDDKDNNVYRLERVPVQQCDAAIAKMIKKDGGC
jgi:hypothetical protein